MVVSFSKARLKRQLVVMFHIILFTLPTAFSQDKCCTRAMFSYPSGDAIPPECSVDTIKCTESVITMENPASTSTAVRSFLSRATKTGAIIVHGNADPPLIISNLKEISHEGPGPALFLKNPKLVAGNCFNQLQKISVKDISTYCEKRDLLRLEGVTAEVRNILETVANQTLLECEKLTTTAVVDTTTTTIISSSVTSNNTLGLPHACVHNVSSAASASASAQNKDEEKECPSYTGLLYAGTIAIALLLITSAVAITVATRLYFFRKDEDAALAVYISHVTQLMNMMIFLQSGKDNSMLHGYMLDGLHKKSAPLKAITDKYHAQANVRKHKFQKNQPLDPKTDLLWKATSHWTQEFRLSDKQEKTEEFIEAASKFETVKKAHIAGREFEPPKGIRIWSDLRLGEQEKMKFAKLPEQPIVEMKSKHKLPKGLPKNVLMKRRQKGGGDPASKATTSVDGTDKKEDTKAQELKNGVPKTEDPKKGQPKKDDQKKEEVKQGNEPVVHKTADTIVRRVLKSDEPKKIFIMPQEKILLEECQPLSLTSPVQTNYETFKTKSKVLRDTFTVFTLVMQELRDYFDIHAKALEIINLNANHAEIKMIQNARYNGVYDVMNASYPGFSSPINWPVCKCRPQQPSLAYDELKRLRASSSKANEKRLLELLEAQHEEMANLLHAEGLNYFYWYKTFVPVEQAVLPGESFGDACKRVFSSHDRSTELGDLMALVHNSPHPNEKLPKAKILPAPKTSKEKKEKDSNEKDSKDKKPKKA